MLGTRGRYTRVGQGRCLTMLIPALLREYQTRVRVEIRHEPMPGNAPISEEDEKLRECYTR